MATLRLIGYISPFSPQNLKICIILYLHYNLQSKSFPVEKLSAAAAGFLISGESLAYRLDSTWKLISGGGG